MTDEPDEVYAPRPGKATEQLFEVAVFLFLIVPSMVLSFFVSRQGKVSFAFVAVSTMLRDLALVSLIAFFVWRNGEPSAVLGWRFRHLYREGIVGLLLYVPFTFLVGLIEEGLLQVGFSEPRMPAPSFFQFRGQFDLVLAVALVVVVAICEETIFRGYLYLRLRAVTRSPLVALLLASAIFALGHGYEGTLGLVTVGFMGLIFNLVYLWRKSLVAPIVMHFLQDFIGIVLVHFISK